MLSAPWMSMYYFLLQGNSGCLCRLVVIYRHLIILFVFPLSDSSCRLFDEEVVAHLVQVVLLCIVFKLNSEVMDRTQTSGNDSISASQPMPHQRKFNIHLNRTALSQLSIPYVYFWKYCFWKSSLHAHLVSWLLSLIVCKSK